MLKVKNYFYAVVMMVSLLASSAYAEKYQLRVQELSTVAAGEPVMLGHLIADASQIKDLVLYEKIHRMVVSEGITEEKAEIAGNQVVSKLRQVLSFTDLQRVSLSIPDVIRVRTQRNYLSRKEIEFQIRAQANRFCQSCDVEMEDLRIPEFPTREEVLNWKVDYNPLKNAGGFLLPLTAETSKGRLALWISGKMSLYTTAWVAQRALRVGEKVNASDFTQRKMKLSFLKDRFAEAEDFSNKQAAKYIAFGQVVYFSDLQSPFSAFRGQPVRVLLQDNSLNALEVSIQGLAKQDGRIGDRIQIEYPETKKVLVGEVIDVNTVRVQ